MLQSFLDMFHFSFTSSHVPLPHLKARYWPKCIPKEDFFPEMKRLVPNCCPLIVDELTMIKVSRWQYRLGQFCLKCPETETPLMYDPPISSDSIRSIHWCVLISVVRHRFNQFSQSRRRPRLGPSPCWKRLPALSYLRQLGRKCNYHKEGRL